MPELPEVEVTRRSLAHRIRGAKIRSVRLGKPLRWPLGVAPAQLEGLRVQAVRRRGKYLLLELSRGILLLHLGMSGSLSFGAAGPAGSHDHLDLCTNQGVLRLHDPRRFGAAVWLPDLQAPMARKLLDGLGAEPLGRDFDRAGFYRALHGRRAAIKQVLLSGRVVVGVGNIYACEALFWAGIRPTLRANRLSRRRCDALHASIVQVLKDAIERGGSSLRDFSDPAGKTGYFQLDAAVYGRAGQACSRCGTTIRRITQGQRSTYYCPGCQTF